MNLTSQGLTQRRNKERCKNAMSKVQAILSSTRLGTGLPRGSTSYVMETYIRSQYMYNAILLDETEELETMDEEVCKRTFQYLLKSREGSISAQALIRLRNLFQLIPLERGWKGTR